MAQEIEKETYGAAGPETYKFIKRVTHGAEGVLQAAVRSKYAADTGCVVLLQLTVLVIFLTPRGLKGMPKHCIFEHFLQFLNLI